jgi:hypothetical protein
MERKIITIAELYAREILQQNNWWELSRKAKLTEDIIEEFQDKLDWESIRQYQILTIEFRKNIKKNYQLANIMINLLC